ncbi:MAG: hypothetical protein BAA01_13895 [Bacillus thermozeamaize]|uniref:Glycosyl transferase family 1 domain-containing protein n=1 Tax=Bacillus thermozeamaize TaxID=230954 RepID=A0A1Y3PPP5_9BACI|nr:MAG: hypothetical protein BAA01_13895 [Bacillus thermozeamaize]
MILMVLPARAPENGGNWVHARRLQKGLRQWGWEVVIKTLENVEERELATADLLHLFNAYRTGTPLMPVVRKKYREKRVIISLTGTDINEYLHHPSTRADTVQAMDWADRLVCITPAAQRRLAHQFPMWREKVTVIPPAVDLPVGSGHLKRAELGWSDEELIFFLPAGLRSVKNPLLAVEPLGRLFAETKNIRFCIAGPPMNGKILETLHLLARKNAWLTYLGTIPQSQIGNYYLLSDVVLNTSRSEGLSHALLEGMFFGKPVLASRVPGNQDLVRHGVDGFLFSDAEEMYAYAKRLYEDPQLRMEMGQEGKRRVSAEYVPSVEWRRYHELYSALLSVYI